MDRKRSRALALASAFVALSGWLPMEPVATALEAQTFLLSARGAEPGAEAQIHLERARALSLLGRFDESREELQRAATLQREAGILPTEALWRIAEIYYGQEKDLQAAGVLVELAREAERRGEPVVEARALLEAAVLYQGKGRHDEARFLINRLEQLRRSPYLSDELRDQIDARIATPFPWRTSAGGPV